MKRSLPTATRCRRWWWAVTAGRAQCTLLGLDRALERALNQAVVDLDASRAHQLHYRLGACYLDPAHSEVTLLELCERVEAVNANGLDLLRTILRAGANPNAKDSCETGEHALHKAARYGWTAAISALVEHGARLEDVDGDHCTALLASLDFEFLPGDRRAAPRIMTALALLEAGAYPNACDKRRRSPLHRLMGGKQLFTLGFNQASARVLELLDALENKGAQFQAKDADGVTPVESWYQALCAHPQLGDCAHAIEAWLDLRPHLLDGLQVAHLTQTPGDGQERILRKLHATSPALLFNPSPQTHENAWHGLARNKKATRQSVAFLLTTLPLSLLKAPNELGQTPLDLMQAHWKGSTPILQIHALVRKAVMQQQWQTQVEHNAPPVIGGRL